MLFRQTLLYLPAQVLAPLVQAATILVWAHLLPATEIGVATLLVALSEIAFALVFAWWSHFVLRHFSRLTADGLRPRFLATEPSALAAGLLLQMLLVPPLLLAYFGEIATPGFLALALAYMTTRALHHYGAERARAGARIGLYTLLHLGVPALGLFAGLILIDRFGPSAAAVLAGLALAQSLGVLAAAASGIGRLSRPDPAILRQALSFGAPMMAAALLAVLALNTPRFLVDRQMGLAAAGIFAVSYGLGLRASSLASMLVTAGAYPLAARIRDSEGRAAGHAQLRHNWILLAAVVLPAAIGLAAIGPSLAEILLPADFVATAALVLPLAALAGLLRDMRSHAVNQVFLLENRPGHATAIGAADLALVVLLAAAGIVIWGLPGAAAGAMLAAAISLALALCLAMRRFHFHPPFAPLVRIFLAALIMGIGVVLLPETATLPGLLASIALGIALYAAALVLLMPSLRRALVEICT